jgi:hypothetical protein
MFGRSLLLSIHRILQINSELKKVSTPYSLYSDQQRIKNLNERKSIIDLHSFFIDTCVQLHNARTCLDFYSMHLTD